MLELVGIEDLKRRDCRELSGGQVQRLNIARALVREPGILLLDEPTTHLDRNAQAALVDLLRSIRQTLGLAMVVVSHDEDQARSLADRAYRISDLALTLDWGESACR